MGNYEFLKKEGAPQLLVQALRLYGTKEVVGTKDNPVILNWAKELGLEKTYTKDSIPWCGLFMAYVCRKSGVDVIKNPLWAQNWKNWGSAQKTAGLGDILVFVRDGGGHVGIYVGEDKTCYHVLGGNQSDSVCITRIEKSRCIAIRRTKWKISQPKNVRPIQLSAKGVISKNEA